ncbi:MAG: glycyl-radical enzyme activating protein [Candidatus Hodarchaeota archaeon]
MEHDTQSETGLIFDVQRYSIHDGPGIRTVVFLKGCPMSCIWCQNPEGKKKGKEIGFNMIKCIGCGVCEETCSLECINLEEDWRIDRQICTICGECVESCYAEALTIFGREMSVNEVIEIIEKDKPFYAQTNGGVTLSGGEPTMQMSFINRLLKECKKRGLNTAIETCGFFNWEDFKQLLDYLDWLLFDLKMIDEIKHKKYCKVSNKNILKNAQNVSKYFENIHFRFTVIPGVNDDSKNVRKICQFLKIMEVDELHIIPYHKLGYEKYRILGLKPLDTHIKKIKPKMIEKVKGILLKEDIIPIIVE